MTTPGPAGGWGPGGFRRQWRFYRTAAGREPVREFLDDLSEEDGSRIAAAMLGSGCAAARIVT
jgi:hypothetical protein